MPTQEKAIINYRQKTLLGLLRVFKGRLPRRDFQKYLFLYSQEFEKEPSYEFVPYKYGCFSFQSYADKRRLVEIGALQDDEDWKLDDNYNRPSLFEDEIFERFYKKYSSLNGDALVQDVYRRYPYYATKSEIAERLMNDTDLDLISSAVPKGQKSVFFTIGYEGSSFEGYLNRLLKNNIKTLVDVRRNPLSRKYGFSKKTLSETVTKLGMEYVHIPELGIASEKRQKLNTQADYNRLFNSYEKKELKQNAAALDQLFKIFKTKKRIAITCFEAEVCMCHRGRIVKALSERPDWQYEIRHI